ncbi:hypothetical protein [Devosia sp. CAU 1758]
MAERVRPIRYALEVLSTLVLVLALAGLTGSAMGIGGGGGAAVFIALYLMFGMPWWAVFAGFKITGYFVIVILAALVNVVLLAGFAIPGNIGRIVYLFLTWGSYLALLGATLSILPPLIA